MFCPKCGNQLPDEANFCIKCGFKVSGIINPAPTFEEEEQFVDEPRRTATPKRTAEPKRTAAPKRAAAPVEETKVKSKKKRRSQEQEVPEEELAYYETHEVYSTIGDDEYNYRELPTKQLEGIHRIYALDFLIRMTQKFNIPTLIYLIINVFLIGCVCTMVFQLPVLWGMIVGVVIYAASVSVALSPIGEAILRRKSKGYIITDPDIICYVEPLFREVYYKAKEIHPEISPDVRLYMTDDEYVNACATGRRSVCITKGLLRESPETIKAILAHEFGHLAHRDTDKLLIIIVGNMIVNLIIVVIRIFIEICHVIFIIIGCILGGTRGFVFAALSHLYSLLLLVIVTGLNRLWTFIGICLLRKTDREDEYNADAFSYVLGYGKALADFFDKPEAIEQKKKRQGLLAQLAKDHPDDLDRVVYLRSLIAGIEKPRII